MYILNYLVLTVQVLERFVVIKGEKYAEQLDTKCFTHCEMVTHCRNVTSKDCHENKLHRDAG